MQLESAIKKRKSVRNYSNKKADWRKILRALDYARFAPMAGGQFSLKFILVSDESKIKFLEQASQQKFVANASQALLVVSNREKVEKGYDHYKKGFAAQQAGAAIQNILLGLTENQIAACWVGFFQEEMVKREFKISNSMTIEAIITLGKESKVSSGKKESLKPDLEAVLFFEEWGKRNMGKDTTIKN